MQTIKKKELKKYQFTDLIDSKDDEKEIEGEIDELVGSTGAPISGDEVNVNNSEIKTAPQATTNDFANIAIQPNRYLYNVGGSGYSRGANFNGMESVNKIAKDKMINLLENIPFESEEPIIDKNNNDVNDVDELSPNVINKLKGLADTVEKNNLNQNDSKTVVDYLYNRLKKRIENNA